MTLSALVHQYTCEFPLVESEQDLLRASGLESAAPKRRAEFLAGRHCARQALLAAGGPATHAIGIGPDRAPLWPEGWVGSISHTQGYVAAAVARSTDLAGLGIDTESLMDAETAARVRPRILTEVEWSTYLTDPILRAQWTEAEFVTLIFSAKESLYKCFRPLTGRFFGFEAAEIREVDSAACIFNFCLTQEIGLGFDAGFTGAGRFMRDSTRIHTAIELVR